MKIVFATNNAHKLSEIKSILGSSIEIVSLSDIGCTVDIPETGKTLEENAHIKAAYVFEHYGLSCFADDTGLEVEALHGAPGVYSARYAGGAGHDSEANMRKLLGELANEPHRNARFRTVISLLQVDENHPQKPNDHQIERLVTGHMATEKHGQEGFGYDPIFIPDGYDQSFAELGETIKNKISHRARAVEQLALFLKTGR